MEQTNLDIYGHAPIPWSRAERLIEAAGRSEGPGRSWFLTTATPRGRPHAAGVGALWDGGKLYVVSGPRTRKSRDLERNPRCALSIALDGLDLVVEGRAKKVTDDATLQRIAKRYQASGWPAKVEDGAFTAEYSAPSAGPPPWDLWVVTPVTAFGLASAEPFGATRWRF